MKIIRVLANQIRLKILAVRNMFKINKSRKEIASLHNIHKGKRCFIVGNGPSLKVEDLEKLKGETCFGTHRIYNIFDKTDWRPDYYCAQDHKLISSSSEEIKKLEAKRKFIGMLPYAKYPKIHNALFVKMNIDAFYPELPQFSEDISRKGIYEGFTVSYMCLQIAAYMGFSEIYLLGVDHSYSKVLLPDGEVLKVQNTKDHFSEKDTIENIPQLYKSTLAYEKSKLYAKENGIKVLNATRGGNLDVFERVDFDLLF